MPWAVNKKQMIPIKKLQDIHESFPKPKPPKIPDGGCRFCGAPPAKFVPVTGQQRKCTSCGAYEWAHAVEAELMHRLSGKRRKREHTRPAAFAPPELFDFTKTDLIDLVWGLAEKISADRTKEVIVNEYERQYKQQQKARKEKRKPKLPGRVQELLQPYSGKCSK